MAIIKKTLGIFSLTCCEGCEFALLKDYSNFNNLLNFYDLKNFRMGQEINLPGPFDISLVEGTPESLGEYKFLHEIRRQSKILIALGACADLGGIQSQRNHLPKKLIDRPLVKTLREVVRVDYVIPGCPIDNTEAIQILLDLYWGKIVRLPDHAVCFECRQNENECLIKNGKPCLGPITRAGCDSICVNAGESCLGCRGPLAQANFYKIKEVLKPILEDEEIENWLTIYGPYEKIHHDLYKKDN